MSLLAVVIDTNVIVSAILFGGKPRDILQMVVDRRLRAVTSPALLGELLDVLAKKFFFPQAKLRLLERKIKALFTVVYPTKHLTVLHDAADNRVLEAAKAGGCTYIITGDKALISLALYKNMYIVTPEQFLNIDG